MVLSIFCGTTILQNICHVLPGLNRKKKKKAETAEDTMFIIYKDLDFHWFY